MKYSASCQRFMSDFLFVQIHKERLLNRLNPRRMDGYILDGIYIAKNKEIAFDCYTPYTALLHALSSMFCSLNSLIHSFTLACSRALSGR